MGSKQKGLRRSLIEQTVALINIPMTGHVDSLNLSNAASFILYEIFNQHKVKI